MHALEVVSRIGQQCVLNPFCCAFAATLLVYVFVCVYLCCGGSGTCLALLMYAVFLLMCSVRASLVDKG